MKKSKSSVGGKTAPPTSPFSIQENRGEKAAPGMAKMKDGTEVPFGVPELGAGYSEYTLDDNVEKRVWEFTDKYQEAPAKVFVYMGKLHIGPYPKLAEEEDEKAAA